MGDETEDIFKKKGSLIFVAAVLSIFLILALPSGGEVPEVLQSDGYVEAEVHLQGQNLLLRHRCQGLGMVVSKDQARSISYGLRGELWERPGSHDLMVDALRGYDIDIVMARVHGLRDGAYIADLFLKKHDKVFRLDSRPSDAVAVALRTGSPIKVEKDLLLDHGRNIC